MNKPAVYLFVAGIVAGDRALLGSGHGPVFGLATPTNPKGGFSADLTLMGRAGQGKDGSMLRGSLGYGVTENLKVSISAPVVITAEPFAPARMSAFTPMTGDVEGLAIWRFHRRDTGVGSRVESALVGGVLVPGPQKTGGVLRDVKTGVGAIVGGVTGFASRSNYFWIGTTYQRYAESKSDRRPDLLMYTAAYAYRPRSWRTDKGWDWRVFGELTGERAGKFQRSGVQIPGTDSHQVFLGPTTLGVYKNYGVSAGIQFPVYRAVSGLYPKERFRWSVNFAYFF
ncbi:MAG TPA: hypothetical protein VE621_05600 [Bryobacteraceae bacterium]|nr:hypothetical protein [Bryobacteraceae bacterium]